MAENQSKPLPEFSAKDIERFWSKVDRRGPNECWPWKGSFTHNGYGQFGVFHDGKMRYLRAHRTALYLATGKDIYPLESLHTCVGNPGCCNPRHVRPGTKSENAIGRTNQGRSARQKLSMDQILEIQRLRASGEHTLEQLGKMFGVRPDYICSIATGKAWSHMAQPSARKLHSGKSINLEIARQIRSDYASGLTLKQLSAKYGISVSSTHNVTSRKTWVEPQEG